MQKYNWNRKRIEKRKTWKKRDILSRLVTPTGTKGCASHVGAGCTFCPGWCYQPNTNRDKRSSFVPDWRSRLGNRDNRGFPTGTNQCFCSSVSISNVAGSLLSTCMLTYPGIFGMIDDTLLPVSVPFTGGPSFHKQCKLDICVGQTEKVGERNEWDHSVTLYFLLSQMYKKRGIKWESTGTSIERTVT